MTEEEYQHVIDLAVQQQETLDRLEQERMEEQEGTEVIQPSLGTLVDPPEFNPANLRSTDSGAYTIGIDPVDEAIMPEIEPILPHKKRTKKKAQTNPVIDNNKLFRKKILAIAQATMGKQNASIETNSTQGGHGPSKEMLMLKWDYIHMVNRSGNTHDISDMYIALPLDDSHFNGSIHGFRGMISSIEHTSGYAHSHLWTHSWNINPFCTGSDGINDLWADIKMTTYSHEEFDIKLEGFIHQLEAFLSYESIEGTPYIRFRNISDRSVRTISSSVISNNARTIIGGMNVTDIDLAMDFNDAEVKLLETEHLHNIMAMISDQHQNRLDNGTYVNLNAEDSADSRGFYIEDTTFNFIGEEHRVFVEPYHNNNKSNDKKKRKYANGRIVREVEQRFEKVGREVLEAFCLKNSISVKDEEEGSNNDWTVFNSRGIVPVNQTSLEGVVGSPVLETEQGSKSGKAGDNKHKSRSSISE